MQEITVSWNLILVNNQQIGQFEGQRIELCVDFCKEDRSFFYPQTSLHNLILMSQMNLNKCRRKVALLSDPVYLELHNTLRVVKDGASKGQEISQRQAKVITHCAESLLLEKSHRSGCCLIQWFDTWAELCIKKWRRTQETTYRTVRAGWKWSWEILEIHGKCN